MRRFKKILVVCDGEADDTIALKTGHAVGERKMVRSSRS